MSQRELERFVDDLGRDPELSRDFRALAENLDRAIRWANTRGYDFSREEAENMDRRGELSEDDLDMVAGGWTDPPPPPPSGSGP